MTVLPHAGASNLSPEELSWPVVTPVQRVRSHFLADTTIPGNFAPEELARPVVDTGSEIITPLSSESLPPGSESEIGHIAQEVSELLNRTPPAERGRLLQQLHRLITRVAAEHPAA